MYELGDAPCSGVGLQWSNEELKSALQGEVAAALFDDEGKANIEAILATSAQTDFAQDGLRRILEDPEKIKNWKVGEAIAETYLTKHRSCNFPWPDSRDERKSGSSLPGADLVGFARVDDGDCLAFGEVKTSSERRYPPGAMYGRTGSEKQLENLRDSEAIRDDLVRYLCHRAESAWWRAQFEHSVGRYLRDKSDIQLFGFLVRDVEPHGNDLKSRVDSLATGCPEATRIELLALYLPIGSLNAIGEQAISMRSRESG